MTYKSILQVILAYSQRTKTTIDITIFFSDRDIDANIVKVDSNFVYLKREAHIYDDCYLISISSINGIRIKNQGSYQDLISEIENMIGGLTAFT